jgi:imidazolonepropionase-like amidohydrolase
MKIRFTIAFFLFLFVCALSAHSQKTAILCKTLIDGTGKTISDAAVIVEGERILSVVKQTEIPSAAVRIDLGGFTLMPGFIDMHCHPLGDGDDDYQTYHLRNSSADKALQGLSNVQGLLRAGWTSIRVPGDLDVGILPFAMQLIKAFLMAQEYSVPAIGFQ